MTTVFPPNSWTLIAAGLCLAQHLAGAEPSAASGTDARLRVIIETDAGGDPDDEQSLVRFLLYCNEWDVEGIIANRPLAREGENRNAERTGLGIVRAQIKAYAACYSTLVRHDPRYPHPDQLWKRTVPGYEDRTEALDLVLASLDRPDPRPVWFSNWGTDHGSSPSNLKRALDLVRRQRGEEEYARVKSRVRLSSADAFGDHTTSIEPPWSLWVDTFRPEFDGKRWYHRFSALTAKAGGLDVERDVRTGHGPLGALYPLNTTHPQKEGDTMAFLYLVPTGMNDVNHPEWGSWAGRYGPKGGAATGYYWANQSDTWQGTTHRDQTLARWARDLQNDFRARLDWCVKPPEEANHPPVAVVNDRPGLGVVRLTASKAAADLGQMELTAVGSSDPDGDQLTYDWWIYSEAGNYRGASAAIADPHSATARLRLPPDLSDHELHVILGVRDQGEPPLARYRRVIVTRELSH